VVRQHRHASPHSCHTRQLSPCSHPRRARPASGTSHHLRRRRHHPCARSWSPPSATSVAGRFAVLWHPFRDDQEVSDENCLPPGSRAPRLSWRCGKCVGAAAARQQQHNRSCPPSAPLASTRSAKLRRLQTQSSSPSPRPTDTGSPRRSAEPAWKLDRVARTGRLPLTVPRACFERLRVAENSQARPNTHIRGGRGVPHLPPSADCRRRRARPTRSFGCARNGRAAEAGSATRCATRRPRSPPAPRAREERGQGLVPPATPAPVGPTTSRPRDASRLRSLSPAASIAGRAGRRGRLAPTLGAVADRSPHGTAVRLRRGPEYCAGRVGFGPPVATCR